jgi:hypothetical protein
MFINIKICFIQDEGKNYITDIYTSLNNVREIYDQFAKDSEDLFLVDKWKYSLKLFHDELYNKMQNEEAEEDSVLVVNLNINNFFFF